MIRCEFEASSGQEYRSKLGFLNPLRLPYFSPWIHSRPTISIILDELFFNQ